MSAPSPSVSKITVKSQKPKEVKARRDRLLRNPDCLALIKEAVAAANGGGECAFCKERALEVNQLLRNTKELLSEKQLLQIEKLQLISEKNEVIRRCDEQLLMWDEDYRVLHEAVDKWHGIADGYKKLYDAAQLKIAKQHGRTRTGGKPGRPRKQPLPSPPQEVIKITPRKRKRAKTS